MTPTPKEHRPSLNVGEVGAGHDGDKIVISGMSGMFPMSDSVAQFSTILYNKLNPVTSESNRWDWNHPEASKYTGKVSDIDRFDSQFFMVHHHLGNCMDPMARKALEHSYQAIYDAGLSPKHLNGKKVGVYIAASLSDTEKTGWINTVSKTGFGITGCSKSMYANRISYWLNAKGPSMTFDDACCGFMVALREAYAAIRRGDCEAAIVGATNVYLYPQCQVHFNRCIQISPDEKTRSFDVNANGCTKSEAISVIFVQKANDALRIYAELVHIKTEFISKLNGETGQLFGFARNPNVSAAFLKEFYHEANISPNVIKYIEACGTANSEADKAELQSIEKVFCDNRTDPLLVGSVISNFGFADAASGGMAMTKLLLGYHNSSIASNLHCETPRQDIKAIQDGRMIILREHQPFCGTYTAVNCLSITGVNSHALLRGYSKSKDLSRYRTSIPRVVTLSARQEKHLTHIFEELKSRPIDPEQLALLHNIHSTKISGYLGRGYIILDTNEQQKTISLSEKTKYFDEVHHPLWFVYSGMGSQWAGMGAQFMQIPIFAAAIERCHKVLEPMGIDLVNVISSPDKSIFDNVMNCFVGIAAIQIGLTDILTALGLKPDNVIGHSVGELGCGYADGCLSAEEMILSAYSRGKVSNEIPSLRGAMAAIGLGKKELSTLCPPSIEIACRNSSTSCTISGPEKDIHTFVASLTAKGIFAREVPCGNIAYHSSYIADLGPHLFDILSKVITEPKTRSGKWVSTSLPQERWNEPMAKYCSAEYLTNNLLNPVLFEETCAMIPSNAVLIEIAPHGLLQAILNKSLPQSCKNIALTKRGHKDNVQLLLNAIGELYMQGYSVQVQHLYPKVEFPVSNGTPHLANLVKWNHDDIWKVESEKLCFTKSASACNFLVSTCDDDYKYLNGNVIQGKILYPFAAALVHVWDTLAMTLGDSKKGISVRFHDVHLFSQPIIHEQKQLRLKVSLHKGSGSFEVVVNGNSKVATGYIVKILNSEPSKFNQADMTFDISSEELYTCFNSRGYSYRDDFRSIYSIGKNLATAQLIWKDNWVTMIDGLLQLNALTHTYEGVCEPTQIRDFIIDVGKHQMAIEKTEGESVMKAEVDEILDCTRCGGIVMNNIKFRNVPNPTPERSFKLRTLTLGDDDNNADISSEEHIALQITTVGDLDTLHWEEGPKLSDTSVKVMVEYAGINMSDVKRATGIKPFEEDEKYYGMDFSGLTVRGERVMGLVRNGSVSNIVSALPELMWPVPSYWSLEEAATVPLAYIQAYYYFFVKNHLQSGSRVLIHGAAGALGQAAISVALAYGCQVFATVANSAKKTFLLKLFPELNEDAIGNSRDGAFGDMVLNATAGNGCDIVISCLRDVRIKDISLKCTAFLGVTVDTEQIQNRENYEYGMFNMTKQRSYIAADIYSIFDSENQAEVNRLHALVSEGIARGIVRPLSRVTFTPRDAPRAFRLLAASRHRGRVLLRMQDSLLHVQPRIVCSPDSNHFIAWDGSSYGLQLAEKLISRGAKKLRIHSFNPNSYHLLKLRLWQKMGVDVEFFSGKLADCDVISAIMNETIKCGPIEGIYVTVTKAISDEKQQSEVAAVTDHLDNISRKLCPQLKYFAVITIDSMNGRSTCLSRSKGGYPATVLTLPGCVNSETKFDTLTEEYFWNRSAVDVTELALRHRNPVLIAQAQAVEKLSLYKLVAAVVDIDNEDEHATLQDLGIGEEVQVIQSFLRNTLHEALEHDEILKLTKKKILELEMSSTVQTLEKLKGLHTFFSFVDDDELRPNTQLMPVSTIVRDIRTMADPIDESLTHLFIIPGLEGNHLRFIALCERLKLPAFVLQQGLDRPKESVHEMALRYSKVLLRNFKVKNNFYLLGYECGIFIALELASILEDHGLTGTVYCIGDGPTELKGLLESELSLFDTESALKEGVARHMFALMAPGSVSPAESALRGCSTTQARIDEIVRFLLDHVSHSAQYVHALIAAAYSRIDTVRRYIATPRALRSRLVLLRAQRDADSGEQCSLQRYSQHPITVIDLACSMGHAANDLIASAVINRYLDKDILDTYENSNLCEVYMLNV